MAKDLEKQNIKIGNIKSREIVEEMKESYIDYAMSVIVSRALPDVRDGLKPVHRRILYAMGEMGLKHNAKFRKSATVVGFCMGAFHPHGDKAIYDSLVRMAQDFSLRYPLIQGQGNFGCFTKDTKVKLCDGRNLSFGNLIKEQKKGKKHWTFTFNPKSQKIEITEIKNPRLTKKNEKIIEIVLDNREKIKCTLDHQFLLRNGKYKQAKDLKIGDSLMPLYSNLCDGKEDKNLKGYEIIYQLKENKWEFIHHLADKYNLKKQIYKKEAGRIRHHRDFNKLNNNPDNIIRIQWQDHWKYHKEIASWRHKNDSEYVRKIAEGRKKFWTNKENKKLRSQLQAERNKIMWQDSKFQELQRKKATQQWQDPEFREKISKVTRVRNLQRIQENPGFMKELTKKAKISLHKNWQNPAYKEKVIKSKILKYVYSLLNKHSKVTPELYEEERVNNGVPRIKNALNHFDSFSKIVANAEKYNHKIIKTRIFKKRENVYDLTVEPWHNFALTAGVFVHNSIDDPTEAAAQRYTECRLSKIGEEMLKDIEKNTVNFIDNYDATKKEPTVLPSPIPQLLLNGSLGIAVGMATNIPPHNLSEVCDACIYLIDNPKTTTEDLFQWVQGPDFPTGGIIYNQKEIIQAYFQGRGPIITRGKVEIIESKKTGRCSIIILEIPFQVQKSTLIQRLAGLVQEKKIDKIKDIRDESDREGMRIVIDLQKGAFPQKILNQLYKFTDLQKTFHLNMLALVDGIQPRILNLAEILNYFIDYRKEIVVKRTKYDLEKAKQRAHILEGLHRCLSNIDAVIKVIKGSASREDAQKNLIKKFRLTQIQANAILEMRLASLAKLERKKIEDELREIKTKIKELATLLESPQKIKKVIKKELAEIKENFSDKRKTKVNVQKVGEINEQDLIPKEETIITLTQGGYIKRISPKTYKIQKRGGKGILGMKTISEDIVEHFLSINTHDNLLFFTDSGKVFRIPVYEIPEGNRVAKGRGLLNFLEISSEDKILSIVGLGHSDEISGVKYLIMVTKNGIIKRTSLSEFDNVRRSGLIAINLKKGDLLTGVRKSTGEDEIILITKKGQSIKFKEKEVREMGRTASGVKGIRLKKGDEVIGMDVIQMKNDNAKFKNTKYKIQNTKYKSYLLVITENGYGKRTEISQYRLQGRGGSGIKTSQITSKTGSLVMAKILTSEEDLIAISQKGQVIRSKISQIAKLSRSTQGVCLMKLETSDKIASAICI